MPTGRSGRSSSRGGRSISRVTRRGAASVITAARLGDALQWAGLPIDAQRAWLAAAELAGLGRPAPALRAGRGAPPCGELKSARERAYVTAARARAAGDHFALRDALTFQAISEIHLGLLREARGSCLALERADGRRGNRQATRRPRPPCLGRGAARERRSLPRDGAPQPTASLRRSR